MTSAHHLQKTNSPADGGKPNMKFTRHNMVEEAVKRVPAVATVFEAEGVSLPDVDWWADLVDALVRTAIQASQSSQATALDALAELFNDMAHNGNNEVEAMLWTGVFEGLSADMDAYNAIYSRLNPKASKLADAALGYAMPPPKSER